MPVGRILTCAGLGRNTTCTITAGLGLRTYSKQTAKYMFDSGCTCVRGGVLRRAGEGSSNDPSGGGLQATPGRLW